MPFNSTFNYLKAIALALFFLSSQSIALTIPPSSSRYTSRSVQEKFFLKESFQTPRKWINQGPVSADTRLVVRININQPNLTNLEERLYAVSDPESPQYGHYLSKQDVLQLSAPSEEALEAVNNWLAGHGFDVANLQRSQSGDSIKLLTTVSKAEEMFNTSYSVFQHAATGQQIIRTNSWSVPESLAKHIDLVHPTTSFTGQKTRKASVLSAADNTGSDQLPAVENLPSRHAIPVDPLCNNTITPSCLFELYNATTYAIQNPNENQMAVTSYLDQFANVANFQHFNAKLRPEAINSSFDVVSINGGQNNQSLSEDGTEADLDAQYGFGLTFPMKAILFTTGGSPPFIPDAKTSTNDNEPYLNWIDFMLSQDTIPGTISTSYFDDEETVPLSYAQKVCSGLGLMGLRGTSLLFAAGDFGVGDNDPDPDTTTCKSNDGKNKTQFLPSFPASCPFVTAVGATVNIPEIASLSFGSGGGFSNYFARPSYQNDTVTRYLNSIGDTYDGLFNSGGRAYPDVAAMGENYAIVFQGTGQFTQGTSAATTTFAGIVALLNDARTGAGMSGLGFMNPFIYKGGFKALTDITIGSNPGCGTPGFNCTAGWDPVTGFGTPNFGYLKDLVLQLPRGSPQILTTPSF